MQIESPAIDLAAGFIHFTEVTPTIRLDMAIEETDLVIIGAGPAGLAAAREAARHGGKVVVLDEAPQPGGRLPSQMHREPRSAGHGAGTWSNGAATARSLAEAAADSGARILCGMTVWGIFPDWYVAVAPTDSSLASKHIPSGFEARAVLIATGAVQNSLLLPGWTLPGVITAGAAQTMINVHKVLPGRPAVIIGVDPLCLAVAQLMGAVGGEVSGIFLPPDNGLQFGSTTTKSAIQAMAEYSAYAPNVLVELLARAGKYMSTIAAACFPPWGVTIGGIPLMLRRSALSIGGSTRAEHVKIAALGLDGRCRPHSERIVPADVVITSSGLSPLVELAQLAGCPLQHIPEMGGWIPVHNERLETPLPGVFIAGSISGVEGAGIAEIQGRIAGLAAAVYLKLADNNGLSQQIFSYQQRISETRRSTIPFYPLIEDGRTRMNQIWHSSFSS